MRSAFSESAVGGYFLDFDVDRLSAARYGLNALEVEDTLATAIGGRTLTTTVAGRERYPVTLRYARDFRGDAEEMKRMRERTFDPFQFLVGGNQERIAAANDDQAVHRLVQLGVVRIHLRGDRRFVVDGLR